MMDFKNQFITGLSGFAIFIILYTIFLPKETIEFLFLTFFSTSISYLMRIFFPVSKEKTPFIFSVCFFILDWIVQTVLLKTFLFFLKSEFFILFAYILAKILTLGILKILKILSKIWESFRFLLGILLGIVLLLLFLNFFN